MYFKVQKQGEDETHHVPLILAAFVPGLLEALSPTSADVSVHYVEKTWKGKYAKHDVLHVHEMLPSSASLLSVPHAISLVGRFLAIFEQDAYIEKKMIFTGNMKQDSVKDNENEKARPVDKRVSEFSKNDFSAYAPRYNAANLFHNVFNLLLDPESAAGIVERNCRISDYLKSQFGHTSTSNVGKDVYAENRSRLLGRGGNKLLLEYEDRGTELSKALDEEKKKIQKMIVIKRVKQGKEKEVGICRIKDETILAETLSKMASLKMNDVKALRVDAHQPASPVEDDVVDRFIHGASMLQYLGPFIPKLDVSQTYVDLSLVPDLWAEVMMDDIAELNSRNFSDGKLRAHEVDVQAACQRALATCGKGATSGMATREKCTLDLSHIGGVMFYTQENLDDEKYAKEQPVHSIPTEQEDAGQITTEQDAEQIPTKQDAKQIQTELYAGQISTEQDAEENEDVEQDEQYEDDEMDEDLQDYMDGGQDDRVLVPMPGQICVALCGKPKTKKSKTKTKTKSDYIMLKENLYCYICLVKSVEETDAKFIIRGNYFTTGSDIREPLTMKAKQEPVSFKLEDFLMVLLPASNETTLLLDQSQVEEIIAAAEDATQVSEIIAAEDAIV